MHTRITCSVCRSGGNALSRSFQSKPVRSSDLLAHVAFPDSPRQSICRHGRDNKLHVWTRIEELPSSIRLGGSAALPGLPIPILCYSMDVNALNYCRFSLMTLPLSHNASGSGSHPDEGGAGSEEPSMQALVALPNLVESSSVRVRELLSTIC